MAKKIIKNWVVEKKNFWQVVPLETIGKLEHPVVQENNLDVKKLA